MIKKGIIGSIAGILSVIVIALLGLATSRLFVIYYGSEINGLVSSVNQVLTYVTILEAGINTTTIQALYKPIAQKDTNKINGILSATHKYYQRIAGYYICSVIIIGLLYSQYLRVDNIASLQIFLLFIIGGVPSVLNYFSFGKYKSLLQADGQGYIISIIQTVSQIIFNMARILFIFKGYDFVLVQSSYILLAVSEALLFRFYIDKKYPYLNCKTKTDFHALKQRKYVMFHQLAGLIYSNTDVILLTFLTGDLKLVSVYTVYNQVFSTINNLLSAANQNLTFIFGYKYVINNDDFVNSIDVYESICYCISFAIYTVIACLFMSFISIYTRGIVDVNYKDMLLALLFLCVQLLSQTKRISNTVIDATGKFKETAHTAIIESAINLLSSIVLILRFGVYGALIGTILALCYRCCVQTIYTNRHILDRSEQISFFKLFYNTIILIVVYSFCKNYLSDINSYYSLIINGICLTCASLLIFYTANLAISKRLREYTYLTYKKIKQKHDSNLSS